jgi:hypothetical protein
MNTATDEPDDTFTVRILWTTDGMLSPIITVSLPEDMCEDERATMLEAIGETARERKGPHKVEVFAGCNCEDHVSIKDGPMHLGALDLRKNGTPRPPPLAAWLRKEMVMTGYLPPLSRLRTEIAWLNPKTREVVIDAK